MRTRRAAYLDKTANTPMFGIEVMVAGKWYRYAEDGKPKLFKTEQKMEAFRAVMRRKPEFKCPSPPLSAEER